MTIINSVGNGLSGASGSGAFVGNNSPSLVTPTLGVASASSINFSTTNGIIGTTTNDTAAAGSVGEEISSLVAEGSAIALTTNTAINITSINLTPGDWQIFGNITFDGNATTNTTFGIACISSSSAALNDASLNASYSFGTAGLVPFVTNYIGLVVPTYRVSISTTTTYYLVAYCGFSISTAKACGSILARRMR